LSGNIFEMYIKPYFLGGKQPYHRLSCSGF
jgi:hypothetical protein